MSLPKRHTVKIPLKPYLLEFILTEYNAQSPIFFPKEDKLNSLLKLLLNKPPAGYIPKAPDGTYLEVILPYYDNFNTEIYNHLPDLSIKIFASRLQKMFKNRFEEFLIVCFSNEISKSEAMDRFIEKYNLPRDPDIKQMLRAQIYRSDKVSKICSKRQYSKKKEAIL